MKIRRVPAIMLATILCASLLCGNAAGFEGVTIKPPDNQIQWVNARDFTVDLRFSGTTAYASTSISGHTGTSKVTATMTLYKYVNGWQYQTSWSGSSNSATLNMSKSCTVSRGYTYKLTVDAAVTRNGSTEYVSKSVQANCP